MEETEQITINNYDDFKNQIQNVITSETSMILAYYMYIFKSGDIDFNSFKELIDEELEPQGIKPFKITKGGSLIFRYENEAEAIMHIKPYKFDLLINKRELYHRG